MESINGAVQLEETELEKDVGVHIDPELKFSKHVERQVNKANRILGLIRRSYEFIDMEVMKKLFTSLVRPQLEFGNVAWSPRLEKDRNLIEGVQRRATKLVPEIKDLEYEERLRKMDLPSLRYRRVRGDMTETYKYTHLKYTVNEDLLVRKEDSVARGHSLKLQKRYCGSATRFNFYSFRIVDSWNYLPQDIINAPTLVTFKARLDKCWSGQKFICTKLDTKQLKSQNKDYLEENENTRSTERP